MQVACPACKNVLMAPAAGPIGCPYCRTTFQIDADPLEAIASEPEPLPRRKRRERASDRTGLYVSVAGVATALLALCGLAIAFWPSGGITAGVKSLVNPDEAAVQAWMAEHSPSPTYELVKITSAGDFKRQRGFIDGWNRLWLVADGDMIIHAHRRIDFKWRHGAAAGWVLDEDTVFVDAHTGRAASLPVATKATGKS